MRKGRCREGEVEVWLRERRNDVRFGCIEDGGWRDRVGGLGGERLGFEWRVLDMRERIMGMVELRDWRRMVDIVFVVWLERRDREFLEMVVGRIRVEVVRDEEWRLDVDGFGGSRGGGLRNVKVFGYGSDVREEFDDWVVK